MSTNTNDINPIRPSDVLPLAAFTQRTDRFLFLLGAGGVGKTSILAKQVAPALGRELWYVNLNGMGPTEVTGYGKILPDSLDMLFSEPSIWPTKRRVGNTPVILFLDEFSDYDPYVSALCRSLFPASGAPRIGPHELGSDVLVVAAGNRRADGVRNSKVEEAPITERCYKATLTSNLGDWLDWLDYDPANNVTPVPALPRLVLREVESHVPAFLKFGSTTGDGLDHFHPPIVSPYDGVPHPCPRTWESAVLADSIRKDDPRLHNILLRGCVGEHAASAYLGFLSLVDQFPDIQQLKANPDSFTVPEQVNMQYALVSACLATATRGVRDVAIAVHSGGFDWLVSLLMRVRGDIKQWGATSAVRRGIPLDEHPKSHALIDV
jgi:hypothetical protein